MNTPIPNNPPNRIAAAITTAYLRDLTGAGHPRRRGATVEERATTSLRGGPRTSAPASRGWCRAAGGRRP